MKGVFSYLFFNPTRVFIPGTVFNARRMNVLEMFLFSSFKNIVESQP